MAAGYELTQTRPLDEDYQNVDERVREVLKYIFEEGFPHNITEVRNGTAPLPDKIFILPPVDLWSSYASFSFISLHAVA